MFDVNSLRHSKINGTKKQKKLIFHLFDCFNLLITNRENIMLDKREYKNYSRQVIRAFLSFLFERNYDCMFIFIIDNYST